MYKRENPFPHALPPSRSLALAGLAMGLFGLAALQPAQASIDVLIIGSTKDSGDVLSNSNSAAFNPTGIRTQLQSILAGTTNETVNVVLEDRDTLYTLANWYHHPLPADVDVLHRWPMLRGESVSGGWSGPQWDYVILIGDPHTMETMPGLYAQGVAAIAKEVAKGTAETVLLMPWPASGSSSTVAHYKDVVYRAGRSGGLKVAPAGLAWDAVGKPTQQARKDFIAAAALYSRIWGDTASKSSYQFSDATLADDVYDVVVANMAASQYSGKFSHQNPFLILDDKNRYCHYSEKGTSTEEDYRYGVNNAMTRANVRFEAASYNDTYNSNTPENDGLGWPVGNSMPIAWNLGRKFAETNKEYVTNPAYWQLGFGFTYQQNTWSMSVADANDTQIDAMDSGDIYLANYMRGPTNLNAGIHSSARCVPWRLLWAQVHREFPTLNPLRDGSGPHINGEFRDAIGTYIYTMYSGRCPLDPKPDPVTERWEMQKIGYETAWRMGHCVTRAPGFKVMPSARNKTSFSQTGSETMTVQFILPPQADVIVNVRSSNPEAVIIGPKKLVFTPENYNVPQNVVINGLHGVATEEIIDVIFETVSDDEACNNVRDSWDYRLTRASATNVAFVDQGTTTVSAIEAQPQVMDFAVAGSTTSNTEFAGPAHGTVAWVDGQLVYTASPGFSGKDGFSYAVRTSTAQTIGYYEIDVQPATVAYGLWSGGAGSAADSNGDGVGNGLAWVLGAASPSAAAHSILPTGDNVSDPSYFIFTYRRADVAQAASNTTITMEYGENLGAWTTAVDDGLNVLISETNDGYGLGVDRVDVRLNRAAFGSGKLFARLRVEIAE